MNYQIEVYETSTGKKPFEKWRNSISDTKVQVAIDLRLDRLQMGNFGQCESLGEGVHELKIDIGPGHRIYFGKISLKIILLLCAGDKKSQQKDIAQAKKYFEEFKKDRKYNGKKNN